MSYPIAPPPSDLPPMIRAQIDELLAAVDASIRRISQEAATVTLAKISGVIARHRADFAHTLDGVGEWIASYLAQNPAADEVALTRPYLADPLRQWSQTSPVLFRVLNTPRDRFDNFEITELLLERRCGGTDITSEIFNDYYQHMVLVEAYRNRFNRMVSRIAAETAARVRPGEPVRILSLHTGSAPELIRLVKDAAFARAAALTCVDADATALRLVRQRLEDQLRGRLRVVRADPRAFVAPGPVTDPGYDILYTITTFDQLSDHQAARMIADCYGWLKPGGVFLFGNYLTSMPASERLLVEWAMNWKIRCRSEAGLRQIFARSSFEAHAISYELDPQQASVLVAARVAA